MRIKVSYRADYHYESTVSFSPHTFRLFPKPDRFVNVRGVKFKTNAAADVQYRRDMFDNEIAVCFYPEKGRDLKSTLTMDLELRVKNPFHFLLESHALDFPFKYLPREQDALLPFLKPRSAKPSAMLPFWKPEPGPLVSALVGLNDAIHKSIRYERRDEGVAREPAETLALGAGACRDFSVLLAETLRANGIAARLASGYLCEFGTKEKRAEGALHAWVEAYLPGAGWVGFDPTNGTLCNHYHITAAVGLVPDDITPVSGSYYNKTRVASTMDASLKLTRDGK
ncbi:MAG TPA: transglutaminase family protein [Chthoniobacteraceae bacterium]|nr:transglutaminase family protein [Chthoniobacteraceae bacterium]